MNRSILASPAHRRAGAVVLVAVAVVVAVVALASTGARPSSSPEVAPTGTAAAIVASPVDDTFATASPAPAPAVGSDDLTSRDVARASGDVGGPGASSSQPAAGSPDPTASPPAAATATPPATRGSLPATTASPPPATTGQPPAPAKPRPAPSGLVIPSVGPPPPIAPPPMGPPPFATPPAGFGPGPGDVATNAACGLTPAAELERAIGDAARATAIPASGWIAGICAWSGATSSFFLTLGTPESLRAAPDPEVPDAASRVQRYGQLAGDDGRVIADLGDGAVLTPAGLALRQDGTYVEITRLRVTDDQLLAIARLALERL